MPEINFTTSLNTPLTDLTSTCFEWCKNQAVIHQSNIDIENLGVVAVALVALLLYQISIDFSDEICDKTRLSKDTLRGYGNIAVFFAFMLLSAFLVYYTWFN